jgi:hypothetical protein
LGVISDTLISGALASFERLQALWMRPAFRKLGRSHPTELGFRIVALGNEPERSIQTMADALRLISDRSPAMLRWLRRGQVHSLVIADMVRFFPPSAHSRRVKMIREVFTWNVVMLDHDWMLRVSADDVAMELAGVAARARLFSAGFRSDAGKSLRSLRIRAFSLEAKIRFAESHLPDGVRLARRWRSELERFLPLLKR